MNQDVIDGKEMVAGIELKGCFALIVCFLRYPLLVASLIGIYPLIYSSNYRMEPYFVWLHGWPGE